MRRVEEWSLIYEYIRSLARIVYRASNKHITVNGIENVPKNEPVIFAPNHQNALDDPLAILLTSSVFQPVFLARADIFKNKFISRILNTFKISPIYRIRDGKESLDKNKEVFENSVRILSNNKMMCLFPEARHIGMKSMLPHKKAIPRIVFIAANQTNFELNVNIVPVGINYSHYYNYRRSIVVNYGKPIKSSQYYSIYKESGETKASSALRDDLYEALKELVIHVPDKEVYDVYELGFELATKKACKKLKLKNSLKHFYECEKFITQKLENQFKQHPQDSAHWQQKAVEYKTLKRRLKFHESELEKGKATFADVFKVGIPALMLLIFGFFGALAHGWLFYLTRYPYRKLIKDKQFYSSFSVVLSLVAYPLWIIGLFFILNSLLNSFLLALILLVFSVPSGIIAWEAGQMFMKLRNRFRIGALLKKNNKSILRLFELRKELNLFFDEVLS